MRRVPRRFPVTRTCFLPLLAAVRTEPPFHHQLCSDLLLLTIGAPSNGTWNLWNGRAQQKQIHSIGSETHTTSFSDNKTTDDGNEHHCKVDSLTCCLELYILLGSVNFLLSPSLTSSVHMKLTVHIYKLFAAVLGPRNTYKIL